MKPFKIYNGPWVDLSSIQAMWEPVFEDRMGHGGLYVFMQIQFAFQNEPLVLRRECETTWDHTPGARLARGCYEPTLNDKGEILSLAEMRDKMFNPLFEAWSESRVLL